MYTGTPTSKGISSFVSRIVTEPKISNEVWLEGLEHYRIHLVREIFPYITLRSLEAEEWMMVERPARCGHQWIFHEHGMYFLDENSEGNILWGLTRQGLWVSGYTVSSDSCGCLRIVEAYVVACECADLIKLHKMTPAMIAGRIKERVERNMIDKYRRYQDLQRSFRNIELFADIVDIKLKQGA
jgi:hypothetical protein